MDKDNLIVAVFALAIGACFGAAVYFAMQPMPQPQPQKWTMTIKYIPPTEEPTNVERK